MLIKLKMNETARFNTVPKAPTFFELYIFSKYKCMHFSKYLHRPHIELRTISVTLPEIQTTMTLTVPTRGCFWQKHISPLMETFRVCGDISLKGKILFQNPSPKEDVTAHTKTVYVKQGPIKP